MAEVPATPGPEQSAPATPGTGPWTRRGRPRTRYLQRGYWTEVSSQEMLNLLQRTLEYVREQAPGDWLVMDLQSDIGREWRGVESTSTEVKLILCSLHARRMKKPQPHGGPAELPIRKSFILLEDNTALTTDYEEWAQMAPSSQVRPLPSTSRQVYMVIYGQTNEGQPEREEPDADRLLEKEQERDRKWVALPRELKLAIKRVHVNLGHADTVANLKALRPSKASVTALKACRLFRCPDCPRMKEPHLPRPSKLPIAEEFNVHIGVDILEEADSTGQKWSWLNVLCQGTTFQLCILLDETHKNPTGQAVLEAFTQGWLSWAGFPEEGLIANRGKYFLALFADELADHAAGSLQQRRHHHGRSGMDEARFSWRQPQ